MKQNYIDILVGVVIPVSNTVIWDTSTHVDLMKMPKKHKTWCSSLDWWLFHTGSVVSLDADLKFFKHKNWSVFSLYADLKFF